MFSRDYLHREGDIVKHIKYLGYTISHIQVRALIQGTKIFLKIEENHVNSKFHIF